MKMIRMGLIALSALTGIGSGFAFNHKAPRTGTLYYAKKINATQSIWVTSRPAGSCSQSSVLDCTITSTSANVTSLPANTFPAQYTPVNNAGKARM